MFETEIAKIKKVELEVIKNLEIQHKKELQAKINIFDNYYLYLLEHDTKIRDVLNSETTVNNKKVKHLQIIYEYGAVIIKGEVEDSDTIGNYRNYSWRLNGKSNFNQDWLDLKNNF